MSGELKMVTLIVTVPADVPYLLMRLSSGFDDANRFSAKIGDQIWWAFGATAEKAMAKAAANLRGGLDNGDAPEANRQLQLRDLVDG